MATKKTESEQTVVEAVKAEPEQKAAKKKDEERVMVMIPFVEGQDPEVTVIINGEITKIKKGHQVKVTRQVASVLENANQQMMVAAENRQKLKSQHQDW